jgi:hypothetical protein
VSGLASHHLREFARTMAAHRLGRQRLHHDVVRGHEVFQVSTINALLEGVYDGDTTVEDLLRHGDFGVGTFDALDGEMVVLGRPSQSSPSSTRRRRPGSTVRWAPMRCTCKRRR